VPTFPPIGATNKIFYIGVAATLIGIFQDLLPQIKNYSKILAALLSLSIVGWIACPCFAKPNMDPGSCGQKANACTSRRTFSIPAQSGNNSPVRAGWGSPPLTSLQKR
jgi:hypothetical protein